MTPIYYARYNIVSYRNLLLFVWGVDRGGWWRWNRKTRRTR